MVEPVQPPSYQKEFNDGLDLFAKSFHGYQESTFQAQKDQYDKVMKESLHIMTQSANAMVNKELSKLKDKLAKDLQNYLDNPSAETESKVETDINQLNQAVH